ncbi:gamma-glutamyltranspeptidase [Lanmaoa asiatica]|nr:gamma-glutamyltranspeptidase [Lanmaoa asiatica]
MSSEKSSSLEDASQHIYLPSLMGFKPIPDDRLPLYTDSPVRARVPSSWKRGFLVISSLCLLLVLICSNPLSCLRSIRSSAISRNPAHLIIADHGAVATENKRCSDIGVDVLKDGGNAVDAAISASLCIGVVNMFSSGIGGGGFMTVRVPPTRPGATSKVFTVDYRETAPALANKTMYVNDPEAARYGGLSVGVPGELRGFEAAHCKWGRLSWQRLVQPSVELAAEWTVDVELAKRIHVEFSDLMHHNKDWRAIFAPEGKLLVEGEPIRRTNYSRTLDIIANEGAGAFYKGPIADSIIRKVRETGGILTHADLKKYRRTAVKVERALEGTYHDKKVYTSSAPTSGPVLLHMLNLLERFDLIREGRTPLNVHRMVEAMKCKTRIGDLLYYTGNITRVSEIPTKEFADLIAANLTDDRTHPPEYYKPEFDVETDHGTVRILRYPDHGCLFLDGQTHVSVVDKDDMAVALTTTVNLVFGSQVLDPETGIILNDEMDDFSIPGTSNGFGLRPSPYNYPEPGKRPLSSTAPTIMEYADGSVYLAIGGSGGSQIFTAVLQTMLNLDWGMDASRAVEYGRVHDQLYPEYVSADNILPTSVIDGLRDRGHNVKVMDINRLAAVVQTVMRKDGKIYAASDSRKNGIAAGY